jgi:hypothetical protein
MLRMIAVTALIYAVFARFWNFANRYDPRLRRVSRRGVSQGWAERSAALPRNVAAK